MRLTALLVLFAGLGSTPAGAVEFRHDNVLPVAPSHNCTCRYKGKDVQLGELRCLATPEGPHSAQCVMEQNVTSWHPVSDPCPEASLRRPVG